MMSGVVSLPSKTPKRPSRPSISGVGVALCFSLALAGGLADREGRIVLSFTLATAFLLYFWVRVMWRALLGLWQRRYVHLLSLAGLLVILGAYGWFSLWALRPDLLPQRGYYDFIANRQVTERLIAPELFKVEQWEIAGVEREVLFVHPPAGGSAALVYPVKIQPRTTLRGYLAIAPEAWTAEGDGVVFSVYVEDEAGMHLLYARYVDAKHHEQDRRWAPFRVDLSAFSGKLVRLILAVNSGPAGDTRYDWAGWAAPRLEQPVWP